VPPGRRHANPIGASNPAHQRDQTAYGSTRPIIIAGDAPYRTRAIGASAYSGWHDSAVIGIHGTDQPGLIKAALRTDVSACAYTDIEQPYALMPIRTAITIE
jgi:hypothetical protein